MMADQEADGAEERWTIRGVSRAAREAAKAAAEAEKISAGEWLSRTILEACAGHPDPADAGQPAPADTGRTAPAARSAGGLPALPPPADIVGDAVRLVSAAVELASASGGQMPPKLSAALGRLLREQAAARLTAVPRARGQAAEDRPGGVE